MLCYFIANGLWNILGHILPFFQELADHRACDINFRRVNNVDTRWQRCFVYFGTLSWIDEHVVVGKDFLTMRPTME